MDCQTLCDWVIRFTAEGIEGLRDRPGSGRPPWLDDGQLAAFKALVLRGPDPKRAARRDEAKEDVLASMTFPKEHRAKLHSTNPLERVNGESKRRTEVVGIFPSALPSPAWPARSRSRRMTNGPCRAPAP
jgi:Transposase, Mutator family/Homeodomain-like domain